MKRIAGRLPQLDLLRTLAVGLVLLVHVPWQLEQMPDLARTIMAPIVCGGWVGVDLFFVLSGFLISSLLFKEHQQHGYISIKRFFLRRGLKIYPPFYFLIAVTLAVFLAIDKPIRGRALVHELLFLQNYGPYMWFHHWSLAVEEHFYLLLPLLLIGLIARGRSAADPFPSFPRIFLAVAFGCLAVRILTLLYAQPLGLYSNPYFVFAHTHARIDGLLFGVLLSYFYHYRPARLAAVFGRHPVLLLIGGLALVSPCFFLPQRSFFITSLGLTFNYLGFGLVLMACLQHLPSRLPLGDTVYRLLAYVGSHSYSIYLWHVPFMAWGMALWRWLWPTAPFALGILYYLGGCIVWGILVANLIEFPVLRLRDRFFPSRTAGLALSPKPRNGFQTCQ